MNQKLKPIFTLKSESGREQRYTVGESGQLIPLIEAKEKEEPWQAANTIAETCRILKLSRNTLMTLIYSGQLKAIKAGLKRWIVPSYGIEEFLNSPTNQTKYNR